MDEAFPWKAMLCRNRGDLEQQWGSRAFGSWAFAVRDQGASALVYPGVGARVPLTHAPA